MSSVGHRLKQARTEAGLSQGELASKCGWENGQKRISNYESDTREPSYPDAVKIGKALGVAASWLAFGDGPGLSTSISSTSEVHAKYHSLSEAGPASNIELPYFEGLDDLALLENAGGPTQGLSTKPFSNSELDAVSVKQEDAAITRVTSNSMDPTIPVGSLIGIDRSSTDVKDGEMYLAHYYDLLIIMRLHRVPGGLRATYVNEKDWPVDLISAEKAEHLRVIGRVFWYSVLR